MQTKQKHALTKDIDPPCVDCAFFKWDSVRHQCANWEKRVCYAHRIQIYSFLFCENTTGVYN